MQALPTMGLETPPRSHRDHTERACQRRTTHWLLVPAEPRCPSACSESPHPAHSLLCCCYSVVPIILSVQAAIPALISKHPALCLSGNCVFPSSVYPQLYT